MERNNKKKIDIVVAGGSGNWCEKNHYPSILKLKQLGFNIRVRVIIDPVNPYKKNEKNVNSRSLTKILEIDKPVWIDVSKYKKADLIKLLNLYQHQKPFDIAIVSTNPAEHYFYSEWAVRKWISVLTDKPPIVFRNSSFDYCSAKQIIPSYFKLIKLATEAYKHNVNFCFCTPLRRRALSSFIYIADCIEKVYEESKQGITHMDIIINNGIHRYPQEFLNGGAHGYFDGIGSLSHSNYHYIDTVTWFLDQCKGFVKNIEISVPYIFRVRDYIDNKGYKALQILIEKYISKFDNQVNLTESILNSELDFISHLKLFDAKRKTIGIILYQSNHTSYSPRLVKFSKKIIDPANIHGRMSHVYYDIHQGALQNIQLIKNDVVFEDYKIKVTRRLHPKLGSKFEKRIYKNPYNKKTITTEDLFTSFIKKSTGLNHDKSIVKRLSTLESQKFTIELFGKLYEIIASDGKKTATIEL